MPKSALGFTLIELLLVIALVSILAVATTPFLSKFVLQTHQNTTYENALSTIRKAQTYAMSGKDNATWGACFVSNNIRLYSGSCSSPTFQESFAVPRSITLTGLSDTTFNKRGEPSGALSISVSSTIDSQTIVLNTAGGLFAE